MRTVWAVSSGSYSDYRIHWMFTTEEAALAAASTMNERSGYQEYDAEEFPLFDPGEFTTRDELKLTVVFDSDGNVVRELEETDRHPADEAHDRIACGPLHEYPTWSFDWRTARPRAWCFAVRGFDDERVRKATSERKARAKAMWPVLMASSEARYKF